jgi:hypothetical protein
MVKRSPDPSWYADARKLRSEGLEAPAICRTLGVSDSQVRWALDEGGFRAKARDRKRRSRGGGKADDSPARHDVFEAYAPKPVRRTIAAPETVRDLARRFAAGEITREQMMRGIDQGAR